MGVGVGDYDLDGHLDLYKTHFVDDSNVLYHNDGKGNFDDVTRAARIAVETRYLCWGAGLVDLDNDGYPEFSWPREMCIPRSNANYRSTLTKHPGSFFAILATEHSRNSGTGGSRRNGSHTAVAAARSATSTTMEISDILIVNLNEPPSLLRNDLSEKQNWIKMKLEGVKSNRSAIGASVLVHYGGKTQAQAVLSQSSFFSCSDSRLHFGLGNATSVDIDVYWPSGLHETFKQIAPNRLITIKEGVGPVPNRGWSKA